MKILWFGHSSFLITSGSGVRIITDPYVTGRGLSYAPITEPADIVTVSHNHSDHNNIHSIPGKPLVVDRSGTKEAKGIVFRGLAVCHDDSNGSQRGENIIFCFTVDGLNICHLGDLGHELGDELVDQIGRVDILMIPVGGLYTVNAVEATRICIAINPRVTLPMHYKTPKCDYNIGTVSEFTDGKKGVRRANQSYLEFIQGKLPAENEIVVLKNAL